MWWNFEWNNTKVYMWSKCIWWEVGCCCWGFLQILLLNVHLLRLLFQSSKNDFRRKWDKDEYENLAQKRLTEERERDRERRDGEKIKIYLFQKIFLSKNKCVIIVFTWFKFNKLSGNDWVFKFGCKVCFCCIIFFSLNTLANIIYSYWRCILTR